MKDHKSNFTKVFLSSGIKKILVTFFVELYLGVINVDRTICLKNWTNSHEIFSILELEADFFVIYRKQKYYVFVWSTTLYHISIHM